MLHTLRAQIGTSPWWHRVLVVDPDPRSLGTMRFGLSEAGLDVVTATNGADALAVLQARAVDLVVADLRLPELGGIGLLQLVRQLECGARIPFIFVATAPSAQERLRALELGVEDLLGRPIYTRELVARTQLVMRRLTRERLECGGSGEAIAGQLAELSVVDLIQATDVHRRAGVITVEALDGRRGFLHFRDGLVVNAEAGQLAGQDAVHRLLTWRDGFFEVAFKPNRTADLIELSVTSLLSDGIRWLEEWGRALERIPALDTVLVVDFRLLIERGGPLSNELADLLRLFDGCRTVRQVIDDCGFSDLGALQAIGAFYQERMLAESRLQLSPAGEFNLPLQLGGKVHPSASSLSLSPAPAPAEVVEKAVAPPPAPTKVEVSAPSLGSIASSAPAPAQAAPAARPAVDDTAELGEPSEPAEAMAGARPGTILRVAAGAVAVLLIVAVTRAISSSAKPAAVAAHAPPLKAAAHSVLLADPPAVAPAPPVVVSAPPMVAPALAPLPTAGPGPAAREVPAPSQPVVTGEGGALKETCRKLRAGGPGKYAETIAACEAALQASPADVDVVLILAGAESDHGQNAKALGWARKAIELDPSVPDAYLFVGTAEQAAGRSQDARAAYEKYIELAPAGKYVADLRAVLKSL